MRLFRLIVLAIVTLVSLALAVGGFAYLSDYAVEATVTDKDCPPPSVFGGGGGTVTVQTQLFAISYTMTGVPAQQCQAVNEGNYVEYRLRSGRTSLWSSEGGPCIYDSVHGIGGCP